MCTNGHMNVSSHFIHFSAGGKAVGRLESLAIRNFRVTNVVLCMICPALSADVIRVYYYYWRCRLPSCRREEVSWQSFSLPFGMVLYCTIHFIIRSSDQSLHMSYQCYDCCRSICPIDHKKSLKKHPVECAIRET